MAHPLEPQLRPPASKARDLPWAAKRPWRPDTHLGWDNGLPCVDLHDLSVKLALEVVELLLERPPDEGGVVLITGRGKHTGGQSSLRTAVEGRLQRAAEAGELRFSPRGPGRFEVIVDAASVRRSRPGLGLLFWLFVALLLLGVVAAIVQRLG